MTPSELKYQVEQTGSLFFTRDNMKFAGDKMSNYGVCSAVIHPWSEPQPIEVWELYRKRPVKHGLQSSAYFRKDTFKQTFDRKD